MIVVLGDLLIDYNLQLPHMHIEPQDLHRLTYLDMGPGGAGNVAITAARLGLAVTCLGEVGDDLFGRLVCEELSSEGIDTAGIQMTRDARTPVATVLVDDRLEPAYLGFPGSLQLAEMPPAWGETIQQAEALFSDGWAEHSGVATVLLQAFQLAQTAGVPVFFDPGPGNPDVDNHWQREAVKLSTVLLATAAEASRLTGQSDPLTSAEMLLSMGPSLVIVKQGAAGCLLLNHTGYEIAPGYPVEVQDKTGAGDSFAGATIYGYLGGLTLSELGILANATGAAKVQKRGTGHNMPWPADIQAVLDHFAPDGIQLLPPHFVKVGSH